MEGLVPPVTQDQQGTPVPPEVPVPAWGLQAPLVTPVTPAQLAKKVADKAEWDQKAREAYQGVQGQLDTWDLQVHREVEVLRVMRAHLDQ